MSKSRSDIDGPNYRQRKRVGEPELMHATLDASDWRTICRHWELYDSARSYADQDERWRDAMPGLYRFVNRKAAASDGPLTIPGSYLGYVYATQWAASVSTMGAARDLADVMTRLVPQVVLGEPKRGAEREAD